LPVNQFLESAPVMEAVNVETMWKAEFREAKVLGVWIPGNKEGVMLLSEETCMLTRGPGSIRYDVRVAYEGR
tara:strand:- start:58 stop:273 length:216 start_codon:yes stop_codon:yes gene_type:complete